MRKRQRRYGSRGSALIISLVVSSLTIVDVAASATSSVTHARDFFPVPAAAMVRPLGEIARGPCPPQGSQTCDGAANGDVVKGNFPMDVAGLGVPVGGVGAGSFMVNQAGTFGPWNFGGPQNATWEMRILPQAAFHVREQVGSAPALVRTLATAGPSNAGTLGPVPLRSWGSPLPAWNALQPGDGTYAALYPFGWVSYAPFATDVSLRFFSPIVAREDRRTSLPVAYFDVRLANHTGESDFVSVMFTMPNAPAHLSGEPTSVRAGFSSRFESDPATGVRAVSLSADDPANTPDAASSQWAITVKPDSGQTVSYATSWNATGDGSDVYAPFAETGSLPDAPLDDSATAGAIAVAVNLRPGEIATIHFALAWDFPQVGFDDNRTIWMRRYTNFYGAAETGSNDYVAGSYPFHQSFRIAADALVDHDAALRAVESWWRPIAEDTAYPLGLRTAALNQLYQLVFNSSFWEGGLVSNTVAPTGGIRLGAAVPGTHLFDTSDSTAALSSDSSAGLNNSNEIDVDSYGYLAYALLFPTLERDRLRGLVEATMLDPNGNAGQGGRLYTVSPSANPFITWPLTPPPSPGTSTFVDIPSKLIFRFYAYARLNDDDAFLRDAYPAMRKNLTYLQKLVEPGHHLPTIPRDFANTYDVIPVNRYDVYDSELYLLSLELLLDAGRRLGQPPPSLSSMQSESIAAKAEFEELFWDSVNQFYRYTPGPTPSEDSVLLDSFFAQHLAERFSLPDLVDPARYHLHLAKHYTRFVGRRDPRGRLLGGFNMALPDGATTWPFLGPFGAFEETEIWPGTNGFAAATYYGAGLRFGDARLTSDALEMASAVAAQIWQIDDNGFVFDPPEAWGHDDTTEVYRYPAYARAMAIWELIDTIKPLRPRPQGSMRSCAPTLHRRSWPRPTECVLPRHSSG
jgi:uncharacterized protein (DUF608 family)